MPKTFYKRKMNSSQDKYYYKTDNKIFGYYQQT